RLGEALALAQLAHGAGTLELLLELLERLIDAFAFLYGYDQHGPFVCFFETECKDSGVVGKSKQNVEVVEELNIYRPLQPLKHFTSSIYRPRNTFRLITSFWISLVPSPIVHSLLSR